MEDLQFQKALLQSFEEQRMIKEEELILSLIREVEEEENKRKQLRNQHVEQNQSGFCSMP